MGSKYLACLIVTILCRASIQGEIDNLIDENDDSNISEVDSLNKKSQYFRAINNFSGNGNVITHQILQGLNAMMQQNSAKLSDIGGATGSSVGGSSDNANIMGSALNLFFNQQQSSGLNYMSILQSVLNLFASNNKRSILDGLPSGKQLYEAIFGSMVKKKTMNPEDYDWVRSLVDKFLNYINELMRSELGRAVLEATRTTKLVNSFLDEDGKFDYKKFVETVENQSFRKYWLSKITSKIAAAVSYLADPFIQQQSMLALEFTVNQLLRLQGVPESALFDTGKPTESLTELANYFARRYLGRKLNTRQYIEPIVQYFQDLLSTARNSGLIGKGIDSEALSNKIADTINLEIVEPVLKVNRAFKFALRVPKCEQYVLCVANQIVKGEPQQFPDLKLSLSRLTSLIASWYLSKRPETSFWSLYHVITEEDQCQARYSKECEEFEIEERKVRSKYIHNEL